MTLLQHLKNVRNVQIDCIKTSAPPPPPRQTARKSEEVEAFKPDEARAFNVAHQSRLHVGQQPSGGTIFQVQWPAAAKKVRRRGAGVKTK